VQAWEREQIWAPRWVDDELAGCDLERIDQPPDERLMERPPA
jgi:hypothetical protein